MACIRERQAKDGRRYYEIRCFARGRGEATTRWYVPDGWSKTAIQRELNNQVTDFEFRFKAGQILTRDERESERAAAEAERARLKTFRQYAEGVFLPAKALEVSVNTKVSYKSNLELYVFPTMGDTLIVEITPAMITKLLLSFMENHSHASTIKLYNIINGVFEMAFLDDSIPINPMLKVKRPKPMKMEEGKVEGVKALDEKELIHVLACVKKEPLKWQAFITLAADTGCRRGELCALEWSDIDLDTGTVTIKRNLQYTPGEGVYFTSPKNGKKRNVDIGQDTIDLLKQWRRAQQTSCICKYVFNPEKSNQNKYKQDVKCHRKQDPEKKKLIPIEAEPMHPQTPTRYFTKFGKRYGVQDFHPHLLRHTSASVAITNGADVTSVSARLGHSDSAVTLRMYAHANEESVRRAGQVVRDALKAAAEGGK